MCVVECSGDAVQNIQYTSEYTVHLGERRTEEPRR